MKVRKKRSKSQLIGEQGEKIVELWATKQSLSATKAGSDYGLDYFFQHFIRKDEMEEMSGNLFTAQCKATKSLKQYIKINKSDVLLYFSLNSALCLIGVDINDEEVRYRFLDENLVRKFVEFFKSDQKTLCLNFHEYLKDEKTLEKDIKKSTNPTTIKSLKTIIIKEFIGNIKKASTRIIDDKAYLSLSVDYISSIINPGALFSDGENHIKDIIDFNIMEIIREYLPDIYGISIIGDIGNIKQLSSKNKSINVISYPHNNDLCFHFKSGLLITVGPALEIDGQHVHKYSYDIVPSNYELATLNNEMAFLMDLYQNRILYLDGQVIIPDIKEWEGFYQWLDLIRFVIDINSNPIIDLSLLNFSDLKSEEFRLKIDIIWHILNKRDLNYPFFPGQRVNEINLSVFKEKLINGNLPLIFSFYGENYIAILTCSITMYEYEGKFWGMKIDKINEVSVENYTLSSEDNNYFPQFWINNDWPAIKIMEDQEYELNINGYSWPVGLVYE